MGKRKKLVTAEVIKAYYKVVLYQKIVNGIEEIIHV